jgi:hypothetical protein
VKDISLRAPHLQVRTASSARYSQVLPPHPGTTRHDSFRRRQSASCFVASTVWTVREANTSERASVFRAVVTCACVSDRQPARDTRVGHCVNIIPCSHCRTVRPTDGPSFGPSLCPSFRVSIVRSVVVSVGQFLGRKPGRNVGQSVGPSVRVNRISDRPSDGPTV